MLSFGKKMADCRKKVGLSQKELSKILNTSYSVIGKYERDEMTPSINAARKIAKILNTTVGYLLGETEVYIHSRTLCPNNLSEASGTFSVVDGMIKVNGNRSHLFYVGPVQNHNFKNFELKADIMTKPGSNSGVYFHTEYFHLLHR